MIMVIVGVLCLIGLVMVLSATTVTSTKETGSAYHYFFKQARWMAGGFAGLAGAYFFGYQRLRKLLPIGIVISILGLVAVLLPEPISAGPINGSNRWLRFGSTQVQPSEFAKLALICWIASLLASRSRWLDDYRKTVIPVGVVVSLCCGLILLETDLGSTIIIGAIVAAMLVSSGVRLRPLIAMGVPVLAGFLALSLTGYHKDRWGFLHPLQDVRASNYQLAGSLSSVATGGWFGSGPGSSTAKWGYVPFAHTDAIFAVIGEELGVVGGAVVVALYVGLFVAGVHVARHASDLYGSLIALGISVWIALQAFVNIGVTLGVVPNKGFTLPFVSYGGSSLLVMLTTVGVLLSVAASPREQNARGRVRSHR
jgi:cell division protein FtsW